jgi:hypothetical protein
MLTSKSNLESPIKPEFKACISKLAEKFDLNANQAVGVCARAGFNSHLVSFSKTGLSA